MNKKRVIDYAVYITVGLTLCLAVVWAAFYLPYEIPEFFWSALALAANTAVLFGYTTAEHRASWKLASYWFVMGGLLVLHAGAFAIILSTFKGWRPMWSVALLPIEFAGIEAILWATGHRAHR